VCSFWILWFHAFQTYFASFAPNDTQEAPFSIIQSVIQSVTQSITQSIIQSSTYVPQREEAGQEDVNERVSPEIFSILEYSRSESNDAFLDVPEKCRFFLKENRKGSRFPVVFRERYLFCAFVFR